MTSELSATHSVAERAYQYIRTRMLNGTLAPGAKLVTRTIAREVGGSLNPVREAISRLATEGLVQHVPGTGASVRELSRADIENLYGVRMAMEPYAAGRAAALIEEDELAQLQEICDVFSRLAHDLRKRATLDEESATAWLNATVAFRQILIGAARNPFLSRIIADMQVLTLIFDAHRRVGAVPTLAQAASTWKTHTKLVRLLRSRVPDAGDEVRALVLHQLQLGLGHTLSVYDDSSG